MSRAARVLGLLGALCIAWASAACGGAKPEDTSVRCGDGTIAVDGLCVVADQTANTAPKQCRTGLVEVNGWCVAPDAGSVAVDAGRSLQCGPGTMNMDGMCVVAAPTGCTTDAQCDPDQVCMDRACRASTPPAGTNPANPTAQENLLTGTEDWKLTNSAVGREIEGYASRTSVNLGGSIALYVSTKALNYSIDVFRMGYYGGLGGRRVLPSVSRAGTLQTIPAADGDGLVECDWVDPYTLDIPSDWVSGIYVAKLTESEGGHQSYIVFVVRDDARVSDFLFQSSVTTAQAYNAWAGKSVYDFNSTGARAWRVSFNRPYGLGVAGVDAGDGMGAGELLASESNDTPSGRAWEYSMLRFLEREGYDVSYATSIDTHETVDLLANHKAFLSVGHDEYWSWQMRANVESARDHYGTHLGFFSGNDCYWQIRFEPGKHGDLDRTMVVYKDENLDPIAASSDAYLVTSRWALAPLEVNEAGMIGVRYQEGGVYGDLTVYEADSWALAGTGLRRGDVLPGLLGYEVDGVPDGGVPAGITRLMRSPWTAPLSAGTADMVVFQAPSGAWTFGAGSIQFSWGLDEYGNRNPARPVVSTAARRITQNILERFLAPLQPSPSALLMRDDFSGMQRDPLRWSLGVVSEGEAAFDGAVTVSQNQTLTITPRAGVSDLHHAGVVSAQTWDMRRGMASVTLAQAPAANSGSAASFALSIDATHWVRFKLDGAALDMQACAGGAIDTQSVAYDSTQHHVLRLRHLPDSDAFLWEVSADGQSFSSVRQSSVAGLETAAMRAELEAGTAQSESAPGVVVFDDFSMQWTGLLDSFDGPRLAQYWTPGVLSEGESVYDHELAPIQFAGQINIRPFASTPGHHFGGYVSSRSWDLTGGSAQAELSQAAAYGATTVFALGQDAANWVRFRIQSGTLHLEDSAAGVQTEANVAYSAIAQRYLRFVHDSGAAALNWQTSPDAVTWTTVRSKPPAIALTALRAELSAGTTASEAAPDQAVFVSFELRTALQ